MAPVSFFLTADAYEQLQRLAAADGYSVSDFVRLILRKGGYTPRDNPAAQAPLDECTSPTKTAHTA